MIGAQELTAGRSLSPLEEMARVVEQQRIVDRRAEPWIEAEPTRLGVTLAVMVGNVEVDIFRESDDFAGVQRGRVVDEHEIDVGRAAQQRTVVHDRAD